jgi:hypothetical protein
MHQRRNENPLFLTIWQINNDMPWEKWTGDSLEQRIKT